MPIECALLKDVPYHKVCPYCGADIRNPWMRGQVQSSGRKVLGMKYCAVICETCKEIAGWEKPEI